MEKYFEAVKNFLTNMQAIGWEPVPLFFALAGTIITRLLMEDDVLNITSIEDKKWNNKAKLIAYAIGYALSVLAYFGFTKIEDTQDRIQAFLFPIINAGLGYLAWSLFLIVDPINKFKSLFGKKNLPPAGNG